MGRLLSRRLLPPQNVIGWAQGLGRLWNGRLCRSDQQSHAGALLEMYNSDGLSDRGPGPSLSRRLPSPDLMGRPFRPKAPSLLVAAAAAVGNAYIDLAR